MTKISSENIFFQSYSGFSLTFLSSLLYDFLHCFSIFSNYFKQFAKFVPHGHDTCWNSLWLFLIIIGGQGKNRIDNFLWQKVKVKHLIVDEEIEMAQSCKYLSRPWSKQSMSIFNLNHGNFQTELSSRNLPNESVLAIKSSIRFIVNYQLII